MSVPLPSGFRYRTIDADGVRINCAVGGDGPPLLLLHGYPQTHLIWHRVAPELASEFTVVVADLRGYGDSDKPDTGYSKRLMARDQLLVMRALGFERFAVAGHDRGGRVAHRLALDSPEAVTALAVLDIVPTRFAFEHADKAFGLGFSDPAAIRASCEDYRAAASIDLEHDAVDAGRKLTCPTLVLWGEHSFVGTNYDVLAAWREYAAEPVGEALPCDHYLPEEQPGSTASAMRRFFGGPISR
ncbi:alpha/beta hydrolase [Amycolatopsis sp.]|jgi:haloacetate dehalogenase|uniref:alpha/beta fold hydrolase n=1 Tax=Amycolatopsis sp. TaxID=37632 RepID=UPI002E080949|nr:alpha/beta hydrolase [Amycolatopsis sp.]